MCRDGGAFIEGNVYWGFYGSRSHPREVLIGYPLGKLSLLNVMIIVKRGVNAVGSIRLSVCLSVLTPGVLLASLCVQIPSYWLLFFLLAIAGMLASVCVRPT